MPHSCKINDDENFFDNKSSLDRDLTTYEVKYFYLEYRFGCRALKYFICTLNPE